jgi:hypothetical protein
MYSCFMEATYAFAMSVKFTGATSLTSVDDNVRQECVTGSGPVGGTYVARNCNGRTIVIPGSKLTGGGVLTVTPRYSASSQVGLNIYSGALIVMALAGI